MFDDRSEISAGEKFAESDLIGIPYRAIISSRSVKEKGIELKKRTEEKGKIVSVDELLALLVSKPDRGLTSIWSLKLYLPKNKKQDANKTRQKNQVEIKNQSQDFGHLGASATVCFSFQ